MSNVPSRLKLSTAVMAYGGLISAPHAFMWLDFGASLVINSEAVQFVNHAHWDINPVDKARNTALAAATNLGADWLLMIDADTFVVQTHHGHHGPGQQLIQMILDAEFEDAAIVVAPVATRMPGESFIMAYAGENAEAIKLSHGPARTARRLELIEAAAAAVMAINLKRIGEARFAFTAELSEDLEFCRQVREAGGKIYCDTRVATGHMSKSMPIYSERAR